jgi:hypothetical protein
MLHNFLNFLPFIILRGSSEEEERKKNFDIIVKGENFHLLCVLSVGKCFSFSSSFAIDGGNEKKDEARSWSGG